jgi:hypothetical protein
LGLSTPNLLEVGHAIASGTIRVVNLQEVGIGARRRARAHASSSLIKIRALPSFDLANSSPVEASDQHALRDPSGSD